ncbi:MAG: hypothetical protein AAFX44_10445 [Pseudomonadota bacterium]
MDNAKRFARAILAAALLGASALATAQAGGVVVNGRTMTGPEIQAFTEAYGSAPIPGNYWYDARSGLYGYIGGMPLGRMNPGHNYGAMAANASNGTTGVYINGRQLPAQEVAQYAQMFGTVQPGRYWLDASGNVGIEGNSQPMANLYGGMAQANGVSGATAQPTQPGQATVDPRSAGQYTDNEGYTWQRYLLNCQLEQGNAQLVLDVSYIQDVGLTWDTSKRPSPEISGVIGLDQQIRYMQGEFRLNGQAHRFTGRGAHFSFRETLDNSQTGRFDLQGETLLVYYPFSNPNPGRCNLSP